MGKKKKKAKEERWQTVNLPGEDVEPVSRAEALLLDPDYPAVRQYEHQYVLVVETNGWTSVESAAEAVTAAMEAAYGGAEAFDVRPLSSHMEA